MSGDSNTRISAWIPEAWESEIESELDYGDSVSGWVRDAIRFRLDMKNADDEELSSDVNP